MDLWLWPLYFLPVAAALRILPEVKLEGILGGSIIIECPLPEVHVRIYLCREVAESGVCATVVSNKNFVREEYKRRVTLKSRPDKNLFLVEVMELTESDSGVYACGTGLNTDRGKTQQVTLNVHSDYGPFWEEEPIPEIPTWLSRFLQMPMPAWLHVPELASSLEFTSKATTPAQRMEASPATHPAPTPPTTHSPRVSRASPVAAAKPPTFLPSTTASKTSAQEGLLRPQTASFNHHTRLHRQRALNHGHPTPQVEDQGFHILIPTVLGLILLVLLGLVVRKVIQRRKALSRRARRLAVRMRTLEAARRPRVSQRPRSQNNVYSTCPRRPRGADAAGERQDPASGPGASAPPAPPQVIEQEGRIRFPDESPLKPSTEVPIGRTAKRPQAGGSGKDHKSQQLFPPLCRAAGGRYYSISTGSLAASGKIPR
ncbi:immunoglobulin mu Fc receptor isoform X2 [Manis javanica]|uniref:immunoglobulin mu Fc receptor isoform X2 n=1 Tax=Manis javanica TaxID=9974 RepID=UPI003C6D83A4